MTDFIILSIVVAIVHLLGFLAVPRVFRRRATKVVAFFFLGCSAGHAVMPAFGVILSDGFRDWVLRDGLGIREWQLGLSLELAFLVVYLLVVLLTGRQIEQWVFRRPGFGRELRGQGIILSFILIGSLASRFFVSDLDARGWASGSTSNLTGWTRFLALFAGIIWASVLAFAFGIPWRRGMLRSVALSSVTFLGGLLFLRDFLFGARGRPFSTAMMLSVIFFLKNKPRLAYATLLLAIVFVCASSDLMHRYRNEMSVREEFSYAVRFEELTASLKQSQVQLVRKEAPFWYEAVGRWQAVMNSGVLANWALIEHDSAGLRPILGALVSFVPTPLWPAKPRAAQREIYPGEFISGPYFIGLLRSGGGNMPLSPAGLAYWYLGWPGVVMAGISLALFNSFWPCYTCPNLRPTPLGLFALLLYAQFSYVTFSLEPALLVCFCLAHALPLCIAARFLPTITRGARVAGARHGRVSPPKYWRGRRTVWS